jgi:hypothetical protein
VSLKVCPKCGFQQEGDLECLRCGIVFARYRSTRGSMELEPEPEFLEESNSSPIDWLRCFYRIFRWAAYVGLILVLFMILRSSPPPPIVVSSDAAQRAEAKVSKFQASLTPGSEQRLELDQAELNGWLDANLVSKPREAPTSLPPIDSKESVVAWAKRTTARQQEETQGLEQLQTAVKEVKIELREDSLLAYTAFALYGMDLSLELEGRLLVRDGYLRLEPIGGRLGSLPLMGGVLDSAVRRLFDSPENKEKFRLPPQIRDVRVQSRQLIVSAG